MKNGKRLSRRQFTQQTGLSGITLTLGVNGVMSGKPTGEIVNVQTADQTGTELLTWISIDKAGQVSLMTG